MGTHLGAPRGRGGLLRARAPRATPMGDDIEWLDLPGRWTYGVCGDGRIFFIEYGPAPSRCGAWGAAKGGGLGLGCGQSSRSLSRVLAFLPSRGQIAVAVPPLP